MYYGSGVTGIQHENLYDNYRTLILDLATPDSCRAVDTLYLCTYVPMYLFGMYSVHIANILN